MNVYAYAGFSYLFTAAISLFMIGVVVLLNKLMGNNNSNGRDGITMEMSLVATLFPGIASLFVQDPVIACARIFMIIFGFILAYLGFKRTLEPLIMVPMGVGMICINCGVLF